VLSKARKRWGKEVFLSLFGRVVEQCVEAGLVEGRKIHVLHLQRLTWEYVTARGACLACHLRQYCTRSRTGRTIHHLRRRTEVQSLCNREK
jgi:hypothetical protein